MASVNNIKYYLLEVKWGNVGAGAWELNKLIEEIRIKVKDFKTKQINLSTFK